MYLKSASVHQTPFLQGGGHIWDFTSRSSVFFLCQWYLCLWACLQLKNSHVVVEKIVLLVFWQIVFFAIQHRYYFLEVVAVDASESRILCAGMFCHVLITWSCQMRCQNCGSMFFCHIAVWVLQIEHNFFQEGYWVIIILSVLHFLKSNWSAKTKWLCFLLLSHPFIVFVRSIRQKIEYGRLTA